MIQTAITPTNPAALAEQVGCSTTPLKAWLSLSQEDRARVLKSDPDPIAGYWPRPAWDSSEIEDDEDDEDSVMMAVAADPRDRCWSSPRVDVPLTLYRGDYNYGGEKVELAHASIHLRQRVDNRTPVVVVGRREWRYNTAQRSYRLEYTNDVLVMRPQEAADLARVLLAAVAVAGPPTTSPAGAVLADQAAEQGAEQTDVPVIEQIGADQ